MIITEIHEIPDSKFRKLLYVTGLESHLIPHKYRYVYNEAERGMEDGILKIKYSEIEESLLALQIYYYPGIPSIFNIWRERLRQFEVVETQMRESQEQLNNMRIKFPFPREIIKAGRNMGFNTFFNGNYVFLEYPHPFKVGNDLEGYIRYRNVLLWFDYPSLKFSNSMFRIGKNSWANYGAHPHIDGSSICFGNRDNEAIHARIFSPEVYFQIVKETLFSYNPHDPYSSISELRKFISRRKRNLPGIWRRSTDGLVRMSDGMTEHGIKMEIMHIGDDGKIIWDIFPNADLPQHLNEINNKTLRRLKRWITGDNLNGLVQHLNEYRQQSSGSEQSAQSSESGSPNSEFSKLVW